MDIDSKSEGNEIYIGLRSILSICLTAMFSCKADTQCVSKIHDHWCTNHRV